jgi:hypothetical protein
MASGSGVIGENKQVIGSYHYGQAEGVCDGPAKAQKATEIGQSFG